MHSWIRGYAADMNEFLTERFTCDLLRCRKAAFRVCFKYFEKNTDDYVLTIMSFSLQALSKTQFSLLAPNKDGLISLENIRSVLNCF